LANWELNVLSVTGEVADAGTALAGLILVYLGALAARYESLNTKSKADERDYYQRHAWLALSGIVLALAAAFFALIAKSTKPESIATGFASAAAFALIVSFVIAVWAACWTLKGID
jgi:NADH:ubiquinone oxidoreductase subunit 3 (subunit A)